MHHPGSGEVAIALAQAEVRAESGEPAAAPSPIAEQRVNESAQHEGRNDEGGEFPALRSRASDYGQRRIHEYHLEQEQDHDADVVGSMVHQEISILTEQAEWLIEELHRV